MSEGAAGEKTEKATPKKRKDARKRGQVLKSNEVNIAFCSAIMFGFLLIYWPTFFQNMGEIFVTYLNEAYLITATRTLTGDMVLELFSQVVMSFILLCIPVLGVALIAGLAVNLLQVGFMFSTESMKPKLERISPIKGFKRIFSSRTIIELVKSICKVVLLGYILFSEYRKLIDVFPTYIGTDLYTSFMAIMRTIFIIALEMCLVMVAIAAFDYLYQWWKFENDLKMTKQEVKDEYKQTEGDPQVKGRIRQKQRQMSTMRMMQDVPNADVVITNPTHYAVALKYEQGKTGAPQVLAKGTDFVARKIKEVAAEHNVEMVEDRPLARSLYAMCEVGDEIPAEFYQAVADILVYVYRQKQPR